ncbi:hypothetical protein B0H63DRAFT_225851 [Podospora didyma]|uniref:Uncharacterized protein n=1 Tax=Podospora didyma TaxID=330526 RepID=A0AAE0KJS1_9PEZI|nr:hypothetical protein B0H63DRAFT_225851 [Podospora didyma]
MCIIRKLGKTNSLSFVAHTRISSHCLCVCLGPFSHAAAAATSSHLIAHSMSMSMTYHPPMRPPPHHRRRSGLVGVWFLLNEPSLSPSLSTAAAVQTTGKFSFLTPAFSAFSLLFLYPVCGDVTPGCYSAVMVGGGNSPKEWAVTQTTGFGLVWLPLRSRSLGLLLIL